MVGQTTRPETAPLLTPELVVVELAIMRRATPVVAEDLAVASMLLFLVQQRPFRMLSAQEATAVRALWRTAVLEVLA
jgi:hypothetical protein